MVAKTVLVVEDDPFLRIVAEEMFAAAGFEVESVQRADQAVDIVTQRSEQTAFLFTDVQTPGPIDGIDLARLVKTHWPHVEVLVTMASTHSPIAFIHRESLFSTSARAEDTRPTPGGLPNIRVGLFFATVAGSANPPTATRAARRGLPARPAIRDAADQGGITGPTR